jgi:hypothetical protein
MALMPALQFSPAQAQFISAWADPGLQTYLQMRYGQNWRWYWLNWQVNHELLL